VADEVVIGLRFNPRDAGELQRQADRFAADGTHTHMIGMLKRAAAATALGDPLILFTANVEEARSWAQGMAGYGIEPPTIEEVRL
jgi:hypothetical protein